MNKKKNLMHIFIFCTVLAVFFWSVIKPADYSTWLLEVSPAVIILAFFLFLYRKFPLTTLSYLIIAFVTILMFIGGHYIYSKVPLFEWLKDKFELQRNHYDRFGHLMKGLSVIVVREILLRKTELTEGSWLKGISLSIVLALAALYEIAEWLVSKLGGGGQASKNFLGTQGDIWDSQWDMTLTLIGAIISLFLLQKTHDRFLKREIKK